jgi:hypothetical protein
MRPSPYLLAAALAALPTATMADEAQLSDVVARAPSFTLQDLVPTAVVEGVATPFGIQADVASNAEGEPFEATFEFMIPAHANVTMSLLVSESDFAREIVARAIEMAEAGAVPGGEADMKALGEESCVGIVSQNQISCMIGSAAVQFSASDFTGGDGIDYEVTKALFQTLRLDVYRGVFGS